MSKKHIMIDIETLNNRANSVITSIAAVQFNPYTGETFDEFYENIKVQSSLDAGLEINGDTLKWWSKQDHDAFKAQFENAKDLRIVCNEFLNWARKAAKGAGCKRTEMYTWGNPAAFDLSLLKNAHNKADKEYPFGLFKQICLKTLRNLNGDVKNDIEFEGIPHHPIDDCKHQIRMVKMIYDKNPWLLPV